MNIQDWCNANVIQYTFDKVNSVLEIDNKKYLLVEAKDVDFEKKLFDEDFNLILDSDDYDRIENIKPDFYLFQFGGKYYYSQVEKEIKLNLFKYVGDIKQEHRYEMPYIGIHSGYELCNGNRTYEDWIKKAKFLGYKCLGICEKNTLAGAYMFQKEAKKAEVEFIIGETVTVKQESGKEFDVKLYVVDKDGWKDLLNINYHINVLNIEHGKFIYEKDLLKLTKKLVCVFTENFNWDTLAKYSEKCHNVSCQFDPVIWSSDEKNKKYLLEFQEYYKNNVAILPTIICDSYYLDSEDSYIKPLLNKIGKVEFQYHSKDQFFKSKDEIFKQVRELFSNFNAFQSFFDIATGNTQAIFRMCKSFEINDKTLYLPEYEMSDKEKKKFKSNKDLFSYLIRQGFNDRISGKVEDEDIYLDRIENEFEVIEKGGFINYFLILWDVLKWCRENDILTGVGRGSAASSLISYLLYITHIDPIKYKMIFERFLNEARFKSLPDCDIDFESNRRDEVKLYIQNKYTYKNVCCIGTFNNFKIKSCIKDISRELNVDYSKANFISSLIPKIYDDGDFTDMFKCALTDDRIKEFINEYSNLIDAMQLMIFQPKAKSIHAAGVIITPKYKDTNAIYDLLPVRIEGGMLISEWNKDDIDACGFLKEDILGLTQLDKINNIMKLIKKNHNIDVDLFNIDVNDQNVFDYFKRGLTEDVFQFNSDIQKSYMIALQPESIEELNAANALNRPGPMDSNAHIDFIRRKNGEQEVEYDHLLEEITKDTYGLYTFQEQVMQAYKIVTDCTPAESDDFRKLTSKIFEGMEDDPKILKAKKIFFDAYIKKGMTEDYTQNVWDKLIRFSGYGFNIAHSASYAMIGYYSLWFKVYYPLEFWTVSLQFSDEAMISSKITEMNEAGVVKVIAPDINNSDVIFTCEKETNKIYWSIASVKNAGNVSVTIILDERKKNGRYKSLKDFISRVNKSKVNKRVVTSLIIAGCFDNIEKTENVRDRFKILNTYYKDLLLDELPEEYRTNDAIKESFWQLKAKEICGYGFIDYSSVIKNIKTKCKYYSGVQILEAESEDEVLVAGNINLMQERDSKNGKYAKLLIDNNNTLFQAIIWPEVYERYRDSIKQNQIIIFTGVLKKPDRYCSTNSIQSLNSTKIYSL